MRGRLRGLAAASERLPIAPRAGLPDLVVEVLSPATRANDLGAKRELHLGAGVG